MNDNLNRRHRRHASEPGIWNKTFYDHRIGSLDNLDVVDEVDFNFLNNSTDNLNFYSQDSIEPKMSGVKHQRSHDYDDTITRTFYTTNSPSKSTTLNHHPSFHSHRRVRSMPSNELNMLDLFQPLGPSIIDNTALPTIPQGHSRDNADVLDMLPALGSMSMDAFDIFKVTSEDWIDNWKDINQEENSPNPHNQSNGSINQLKTSYTNSKAQSLSSLKSFNSVSPSSSGEFNTFIQQSTMPHPHSYSQTHSFTQLQNQNQSNLQTQTQQKQYQNEFSLSDDFSQELIATDGNQQTNIFSTNSRQLGVASIQAQFVSTNYLQQKPIYQNTNNDNKGHRRSHTTGRISGQDIFGTNEDISLGIPPTSNYQQCYPINTKITPTYQIRHPSIETSNLTTITPSGISDSEYHVGKSLLRPSTTEDLDNFQLKNSRGKYRCGLCGQLKANHNCPYMVEIPTRSIATQVDPPYTDPNVPTSHPFYSGRCITVRSSIKVTSINT